MKRFIIVVMDSVGCGALPDAEAYHSLGADTLGHIAEQVELKLPNLARLGLGNILPLRGIAPVDKPLAAWGKMKEISCGKDTTTGHWEMAGLVFSQPLPTYPQGFPRRNWLRSFARPLVVMCWETAWPLVQKSLSSWAKSICVLLSLFFIPRRTAYARLPLMRRLFPWSACMRYAVSPGKFGRESMA